MIGTATVPVDFAATHHERSRDVAIVGFAKSSAKRSDCALNRRDAWPGGLKHDRPNGGRLCGVTILLLGSVT